MAQMVEVRPLELKRWHNKKGKESFTQPKTVEALYDPNTTKYATGLTDEEVAEYGKKLNTDLSNDFSPDSPHPFWESKQASIKLLNQTMLFDTGKPLEYVKVKLMKASKFVANSQKEYDENKWPDATHVIFDEAEQVAEKASKIQLKTKATVISSDMTNDDKISMIQILSNKSYKGRSQNFIDVEIASIIEEKPEEFLKYFNMGREEVYLRAMVLEGLYKNTLNKEGEAIYYMGELLGIDYESTIKWFKNPNNQRMKVAILEKLGK